MSKIVCAAFLRDRRILMVRRASRRKWSPDRWDLVGGHVDQGEDLITALVRECEEEVGLTPTHHTLMMTIYEDDDAKQKSPFHVYLIRDWNGSEPKLLGDEHSELAWFTWQEIEPTDIALEGYLPILRKILN